jgi:hypothetical protein
MPTRQNVRKYDSPEVQGDDSWVVVRRYEVHEQRAGSARIRWAEGLKDRDKAAYDAFVTEHSASPGDIEGQKILAQNIVKWNWVDTDGTPLPPAGR